MTIKKMKLACAALSILAGMTVYTSVASAAEENAARSGNVCLRTNDIRNTTVPDDKTILFHMNDGKVWKNELLGRCVGLKYNGFVYEATPPNQICGNLQTIRVIQTGSVCMMGAFVRHEGKTVEDSKREDAPPAAHHDHDH